MFIEHFCCFVFQKFKYDDQPVKISRDSARRNSESIPRMPLTIADIRLSMISQVRNFPRQDGPNVSTAASQSVVPAESRCL